MDCPPRAITWTPQWTPAVPPPRGVVHTCPTIRAAGTRCVWLAANSNDDGLQPRSSTATLCMRKADRSSTSHTTNSFWRVCGAQAAGDQRRVAVGGRLPEGDAGASVRGFGVVAIPPLNLEAVCLVACYSYDGGPHWGADVRRPSGIERRNRVPGARAERAPELGGGKFEGNVVASHRLCMCPIKC